MLNQTGPIHAVISTSIRLGAAFVLLAAAIMADPSPAAAQGARSPAGTRIFVTVEGGKGVFMAEPGLAPRTSQILRFHYEVTSPRDLATGQASGKRQHRPITIVKDWGAASPQLFHAAVTNEVLKSVLIEVFRATASGQEEAIVTLRLTNAIVAKFQSKVSDSTSVDGPAGRLIDEIDLSFQKIEISHPGAKTSATDDWHVK